MAEVQPHDEPLCCHGNLCVREDTHTNKTCIPPRDVKEGRKVVGCLGVACIGHMSAAKTLGLSDVYLNSSTALAIRRLLLGIMTSLFCTFEQKAQGQPKVLSTRA